MVHAGANPGHAFEDFASADAVLTVEFAHLRMFNILIVLLV